MPALKLIKAQKPDKGEVFTVSTSKTSLLLKDAADELVLKIPFAELGQRVHFPSFWASVAFITLMDAKGKPWCFEPKPKAVERLKEIVANCLDRDAGGAADVYRKSGLRDLLIGGGSFLLGVVITVGSLLSTQDGQTFVVTYGLIGVGLIEMIRGGYYLVKAGQLSSTAYERDGEYDE